MPAATPEMEAYAKAIYTGNPGLKLAPYFFASFFDAMMAGIAIQQFIHYKTYARGERKLIKWVVYLAMVVNTGFTGYNQALMLNDFVYHTGRYYQFVDPTWFSYYPVLDAIAMIVVQTFYVDRAWRLNGRNPIVLIIIVPIMCLVFAIVIVIKVKFGQLVDIADAVVINTYVYIWNCAIISLAPALSILSVARLPPDAQLTRFLLLGAGAVLDILTMAFIGYGLWKAKTGWSSTDKLIKRLIILGCETQLPPTVFAICLLAQYTIDPSSSMDVFFMMFHPKVYLIGLFVVLNSRYSLRNDIESGEGTSPSNPNNIKGSNTLAGTNRMQQATVHVHTERFIESHQLEPIKFRPNRQPLDGDIKEEELDEHSVDLDYYNNTSKIGLTEDNVHRV